jgi:hypothetical protein
MKERAFANDKVILLWIKLIVVVFISVEFLHFIVDYESHVTETKRHVFSKEHPAVALVVKLVTSMEAKCITFAHLICFELFAVHLSDVIALKSNSLLTNENLIFFSHIGISKLIPENQRVEPMIK